MPKFHFERRRRPTPSSPRSCRSRRSRCPWPPRSSSRPTRRYVERGRAAGAQLQLPGLPPDRRARAARSGRSSSDQLETSGGEHAAGPGPLAAHALQRRSRRSARGRGCRPRGCTGSCGDPSNHIRPWLEVRMPTFEFTEEELNTITQYFAALDKVPYPVRAQAGDRDRALLAAGQGPLREVAVREVPRGGGQAAQPGAGQHGARSGQGAEPPARRLARTLAHRPGADPARHAHARELPDGPERERLPRDPGRRPEEADRGGARLPADPGRGAGGRPIARRHGVDLETDREPRGGAGARRASTALLVGADDPGPGLGRGTLLSGAASRCAAATEDETSRRPRHRAAAPGSCSTSSGPRTSAWPRCRRLRPTPPSRACRC